MGKPGNCRECLLLLKMPLHHKNMVGGCARTLTLNYPLATLMELNGHTMQITLLEMLDQNATKVGIHYCMVNSPNPFDCP